MQTADNEPIRWQIVAAGALLAGLGVFLLAELPERRVVWHPGQLWPLLVVAIAASGISRRERGEQLRKGLVLLAVGFWLLVNTLGIGGAHYGGSWPLLLILIGLAIAVSRRSDRDARSGEGLVLILIGTLAWIATHGLWGLGWRSVWPLVIIAIGVSIVWRAIAEQRHGPHSTQNGGSDAESSRDR